MSPSNPSNSSNDLVFVLGEIKGQLAIILQLSGTLRKDHDDLETRVRLLEQARAWLLGAGAVVGGIGGFLASVVFQ